MTVDTLHLGTGDMVRLVRQVGLAACIAGVAERIGRDFLRWNEFDKSARVAAHSSHGVIELMPIADARSFAFKYVNGHPGNVRHGLPTVMAFGLLADVATGAPRLLCEMTLATAIRTAAVSALAARALARGGSRSMALVGNGAQGEFQAIAFRELLGIRELRLFDTDRAASARLAVNLAGAGLDIRCCASVEETVRGADIVTTATAARARVAVLLPAMIEPGMHLNAIGGDCPGKTELHPVVLEAAQVFVEYEPQTRVEGEIQQLAADHPVTELWRVLAGSAPGRADDRAVTLFDSVGFALEDWSTLAYLHDAAVRLGLGTPIDLVARTADPKNLFGLLVGDAASPAAAGASRQDVGPA